MTRGTSRSARVLRSIGRALAKLPRPTGVLLAALWMAVIWSISEVEGSDGDHSFLGSWLYNSAHAPFYGFLALLLAIALPRTKGWPRLDFVNTALVLVAVLTYAIIDERHQSHVPGRDADWADILTDVIGATVTLWMIRWLGDPASESGGVWRRIAVGLALCLGGGFVATWRSFG